MHTPFGLLGNDENALSFALAWTLYHCPDLLRLLLRELGLTGWHRSWFSDLQIDVQRNREDGITDVELYVPGRLTVVIEAKVGASLPSLRQCQLYLGRFAERPAPTQVLLVLTESEPVAMLQSCRRRDPRLGEVIQAMTWTQLLPMCIRLRSKLPPTRPDGQWLRAFQGFLDQEYRMKCLTEEVWIVAATHDPLWPGGMSFYDTHTAGRIYYRLDSHLRRPLYIALRHRGQVDAIQRVEGVDHEVRPVDYIPELKDVPDDWPQLPHTVWRLSEPTPLPHAIPTGDASMRARRCTCDLDVLLSSGSVREIEQRMTDRRQPQRNGSSGESH